MPDLKQLLEPLDEVEMPDRWDAIRRRPVATSPEPRRSRVPAYAVSAAVAALIVTVVAGLLPLGKTPIERQPGAADQPPAWLAQAAYQAAYVNGDMLPERAEWALLPRNAIPTPVGAGGAGSTEMEYVIVLHGAFTAYASSVPAGASLPTGAVLSIAYDATTHDMTDFGLTDGPTGIEGLHEFTLPPASAVFTSSEGWTAAVPPGWTGGMSVTNWGRSDHAGSYISSSRSFTPVAAAGLPQASSEGFPKDGVAIVVTPTDGPIPLSAQPLPAPPLSADGLANGSAGAGSSTLDSMFFQGPSGVYVLTVRTGADASPQDIQASHDVIRTIAWPSTSSTSSETPPSSAGPATAGLPTADSVVNGRFVESVQLDEGLLRVDPPPPGSAELMSDEIRDLLWASAAFQGKDAVTIGYGLITMQLAQHGIENVESVPGWIAFAKGGVSSCPNMTVAPSPAELPSSGFAAVSDMEGANNFAYSAASDICGKVTQPGVEMATHVESIAWEQVGPVVNGQVNIRYTPPACGRDAVYTVSGDNGVYTLEVDMSVANDPLPCPANLPIEASVDLAGASGTVAEFRHAPEGLVRQAQGAT